MKKIYLAELLCALFAFSEISLSLSQFSKVKMRKVFDILLFVVAAIICVLFESPCNRPVYLTEPGDVTCRRRIPYRADRKYRRAFPCSASPLPSARNGVS